MFVEEITLWQTAPSGSNKKILYKTADIGRWVAPLATGVDYVNCRLTIPETGQNVRKSLEIKLAFAETVIQKFPDGVPQSNRVCDGEVSLRRLFRPEDIPCEPITGFAELSETIGRLRIPAKPGLKVGVSEGYGTDALISVLNKEKEINAFLIPALKEDTLNRCDVIIMTQSFTPQKIESYKNLITKWVNNGGGVLFLHDAVGYRAHIPFFRNIGTGKTHPKLHNFKVTAEHPVMAGLVKGKIFSPGFLYDHIAIAKGPGGQVLVENENGEPVIVIGKVGKGRVVLNGMHTGRAGAQTDGSGTDKEPSGEELKILINSVRWLAQKGLVACSARMHTV
ncbi:hypothetical protein ES703_99254 [subsurface metagenome]